MHRVIYNNVIYLRAPKCTVHASWISTWEFRWIIEAEDVQMCSMHEFKREDVLPSSRWSG